MISKKDLEKFKKLYRNRYREELSDKDALDRATRPVNLIRLVYKPESKDEKSNN